MHLWVVLVNGSRFKQLFLSYHINIFDLTQGSFRRNESKDFTGLSNRNYELSKNIQLKESTGPRARQA